MAPGEEASIAEQKCGTRGSRRDGGGCFAQTNPFPLQDLRWRLYDDELTSLLVSSLGSGAVCVEVLP